MRFMLVKPEVAGGFGQNTVINRGVHPPLVTRLEYRMDGWLGDALLESYPCFIITERVKESLEHAGCTGIRFGEVEVTKSEQFLEVHGERVLPVFVRLFVDGRAGLDDLGLTSDSRLVVSESALRILRTHGLSHAAIADWPCEDRL